jgi:hypothetical protein
MGFGGEDDGELHGVCMIGRVVNTPRVGGVTG